MIVMIIIKIAIQTTRSPLLHCNNKHLHQCHNFSVIILNNALREILNIIIIGMLWYNWCIVFMINNR